MTLVKRSRKLAYILGLVATIAIVAGASAHFAFANPGGGNSIKISGNTPGWVSKAQNLGAADASQTIDLTVWLKLRNENKLQQQLHDLYTPGSSYHKWINQGQFNADYSPTDQQVKSVSNFLSAHGFTILDTAENNFYIKVSGTIAQSEQAFHVQINNYRYNGKTYRSNAAYPRVNDASGGNIANVTGLDDASYYQPFVTRAGARAGDGVNPSTSVAWNVLCGNFSTTKTLTLVGGSTQNYTGFVPCGYGGDQLQKAYGVDQLVANGIDGRGQTVAIVDAYGSPTILTDANAFSKAYGLPKLVMGENFDIVSNNGAANRPETPAQDPIGWQAEVTLDVEAVHSMAPGAKILLVAAPNNYADLDEAVNWVVVHHLANIVTNSWGLSTDLMDPGQASRDERIFMQAAAQGIGLNFSSGDSGDELANTGRKSVDYPASSPWVNAVGGTSLFLNSDNSYNFETGWGTNLQRLYTCKTSMVAGDGLKTCTVYDPAGAHDYGFDGGAGGGLSYNFTAQPWQSSAISGDTAAGFGVVGTHRAVPDVGMLADPYTGMNVWITDLSVGDTAPEIEPYGGTSLASPLFAGIMALVDQQRAANGLAPAGLASQYLYNLPGGAVRDVSNPPSGVGNADGDANSFSLYYGSRYSGSFFNPTFNQDSSLATGSGWDDVTGVGSPNAPGFVAALGH